VSARDLQRLLEHPDPPRLWYQLEEIVESRIYLQEGVEVRPGDVVLDIGANIRVAAAFFAAECRAGAVHCFEPVHLSSSSCNVTFGTSQRASRILTALFPLEQHHDRVLPARLGDLGALRRSDGGARDADAGVAQPRRRRRTSGLGIASPRTSCRATGFIGYIVIRRDGGR
jgi:hypothetical protein